MPSFQFVWVTGAVLWSMEMHLHEWWHQMHFSKSWTDAMNIFFSWQICNVFFRIIFVKIKHLNNCNDPIRFGSWYYFLLGVGEGSGIDPLPVIWDQDLAELCYVVSVVLSEWPQHSCKECSLSWSQRHCSFPFHKSLDFALHKSKFILLIFSPSFIPAH